jgi:hypothetical protein
VKYFVTLVLILNFSGCSGSSSQFASKTHRIKDSNEVTISALPNNDQAELTIQYLGVGGFLFEINNERLLTAPFFSNPYFSKNIPFNNIKSNPKYIEARFPGKLKSNENGVKAVLVGHSHYDHLMDVPYLMENYLEDAKVYGSTTMTAILNNFGIDCGSRGIASAISVNEKAENKEWIDIPDSQIRILPIRSSHAPHFFGMTFQKGHYKCGEQFDLRSAWDWKMGNVYAYLIDFQDDKGNTLFRIYYQDSASNPDGPNSGLVPQQLIEDRSVDITILVLASSGNVKNYPQSRVANTEAELYIVGHWEDFFGSYDREPIVARGSDENRFIADLEKTIHLEQKPGEISHWVLPLPLETITVNR